MLYQLGLLTPDNLTRVSILPVKDALIEQLEHLDSIFEYTCGMVVTLA